MRQIFSAILMALFMVSPPLTAEEDQAIVISRGSAELSLLDLDARVSRIPENERVHLGDQHQTMANMMSRLLLNRQLANEAREMGLDQDPLVARDMEHAIEEVLATHRLNALITLDSLPDFEMLAHERYLANPNQYLVPERITVRHILIAVTEADALSNDGEEREQGEAFDDAAALAKAHAVLAQARQPESDFIALMAEHSDDPGSSESGRTYVIQRTGEFVPEFEAAARELTEQGQISEPVRSSFGYHLIRLEEREDSRIQTFDEVRAELIASVREAYLSDRVLEYRQQLQSQPEQGNEELLLGLPERYGGQPRVFN